MTSFGYGTLSPSCLVSRIPQMRWLSDSCERTTSVSRRLALISAFYCFGHGLGHWGMPRVSQVVYVFAIFALQVGFSHWWLGLFRYGPMEWLWRAITYWRIPPMRLDQAEPGNALTAMGTPAP